MSNRLVVLGIDPGRHNGVATYVNGLLSGFVVLDGQELLEHIPSACPNLVVFEDSRRDPLYPRAGVNARAMARIARSVGEIDQRCREIEDLCKREGIECLAVSPRGKGRKIDAGEFAALTGWTARSNQHMRDAGMVAYPYRHGIEMRRKK